MATITLTGVRSHDYSTDVLSNIDVIKFHTTKSPTIKYHTASFSAAQFDNVHISTAVNIIGDNNADRVIVSGATNFSAAAWTFTNFETFNSIDRVQISGTAGNDTITGSSSTDFILGGGGNDVLDGGGGFDYVSYFFDGAVTVSLAIAGPQNTGGAGTDTLSNFADLEGSQTGGDTLTGDDFDNAILGWGGDDTLNAGVGSDYLFGGLGKDTLTGGLGADTFAFNLKTESAKGANHDIITDFSGVGLDGDHINVHNIDANAKVGGNQNFNFIGAQNFHHHAGELHVLNAGGGSFLVEGDVNGDGKADFQIEVHTTAAALVKGDFVL